MLLILVAFPGKNDQNCFLLDTTTDKLSDIEKEEHQQKVTTLGILLLVNGRKYCQTFFSTFPYKQAND